MTLEVTSLKWAIDFVSSHSDGDIFPKIQEIDAIKLNEDDFINRIVGHTLREFGPGPSRRFIVPKDEISYRQATQLDPQDSILLSAIIHQHGQQIEDRRLPADQVYSYRFEPSEEHGLYSGENLWNAFWTKVHGKAQESDTILYCDIADFYNQIYHHTVENQLIESGLPNQAIKWVISLLESTTAGVSRGVPIGPHGIHLIAEATMIPIDNSLSSNGLDFVRYADDIIIFCNSEENARKTLPLIANILDKQQRLMLQRHKTRLMSRAECQVLCSEMIEDRPINRREAGLLHIIRKYTGGSPYNSISYEKISPEDWAKFGDKNIREVIEEYIAQDEIDFIRLRWFYRRLTQVGHPGAIDVSLENIDKLGPCFANICSYFASVQAIEPDQWKTIGARLLGLLESDNVKNNEFFQLSILSLFSRNSHINHFADLTKRFPDSNPYARREILLAAKANNASDWIREHKENYQHMDVWQQSAFIFCCSDLPPDEKKYFINRCSFTRPFESVLGKWSKNT